MRKESNDPTRTKEKQKEIQNEYQDKFGLTTFSNKNDKFAIVELLPKGCCPTKEQFEMRFWKKTVSQEEKDAEWAKFKTDYLDKVTEEDKVRFA
jgi:hypothetical protein